MIDLTLTVQLEDGERWEITPKLATFVRFEEQFDTAVSSAFAEGTIHLKHLAWLAWDGARRSGRTVPLFDAFVDKLVDLDVVNNDAPLVERA